MGFCDIHLRAISQEVLMNLICNKCSKITFMKFLSYLPGANELNTMAAVRHQAITWTNVKPNLCCHMAYLGHNDLIHSGLVTPYGDWDLGQHWLR